jgi:hypothetical protein
MGTHSGLSHPLPPGRQPEQHRKIPEPTDSEDRSILYGTVFGWTGLLRLRQGRAWNQQKPNRYRETDLRPEPDMRADLTHPANLRNRERKERCLH